MSGEYENPPIDVNLYQNDTHIVINNHAVPLKEKHPPAALVCL